jgi:hypothetical protein
MTGLKPDPPKDRTFQIQDTTDFVSPDKNFRKIVTEAFQKIESDCPTGPRHTQAGV